MEKIWILKGKLLG